MSSPPKETDLKGGHAPAVMVGGKRVVQHRQPREEEPAKPVPVNDGEEEEDEFAKQSSPKAGPVFVSGAKVKGDADFPPAAVQAIHNKPMASKDKITPTKPHLIQQPRK